MESQRIEAAVKGAAESIRKSPAVRRRSNVSYAAVVKVGYEEIQKLRNEGYSYDVICVMLSENGVLGTDASPKHFCAAFLREKRRRLSRKQDSSATLGVNKAPVKKTDFVAVSPNKAAHLKGGEAEKTDLEKEKERIRKQTGTVVDTGLGTIIKHTDGSFDYD